MKIELCWLFETKNREAGREEFIRKLRQFPCGLRSKEELVWGENENKTLSAFIKVEGSQERSLWILAKITEYLSEIKSAIIMDPHKVIFEESDSLDDAKHLIKTLFQIKDHQEGTIREAIKELKKTRKIIANKKLGEIREYLEFRLSNIYSIF